MKAQSGPQVEEQPGRFWQLRFAYIVSSSLALHNAWVMRCSSVESLTGCQQLPGPHESHLPAPLSTPLGSEQLWHC